MGSRRRGKVLAELVGEASDERCGLGGKWNSRVLVMKCERWVGGNIER
jgi:hypothetical protein